MDTNVEVEIAGTDCTVIKSGRGGAREGAGRKPTGKKLGVHIASAHRTIRSSRST